MRITKRDIKVILLLIGILSAFITYQFYLKTKLDDISKKEDEIATLKTEIEDLKMKKRSENLFRTQMAEQDKEVKAKIDEFPANQWYEDGILFLNYMEKRDELLDDEEKKMKIYFDRYTFTEATMVESVIGKLNMTPRHISLLDANTKAEFICDYETLKEMVRVIYANDDTKRMIRNMNIEVKWTGDFPLKGDIEFSSFAIDDDNNKDRVYVPVKVPGYEKVYEKTFTDGQPNGEEYVPETIVSTDPDTGETKYENDDIIGLDCVFGDLTPTTTAEETSSEAY
ncbi:MAG: hypothetical protein IKS10_00250 [Lachnospiraceae bacterium]|nr:hypothetical protein [Lachnospiraceae bacterium]